MPKIKTKRLVYEFDRKFDRFKGKTKDNLRLVDKLSLLTEAQMILYESKVDMADVDDKVRNTLRPFEVKEEKLKIIEGKPRYVVAEYPKDFYKMLRQRAKASKEECDVKKKELPILMFRADKLEAALKNPFWKPSYEWEHILGDEGSLGLYLWHNGEFDIEEIYIDYYRKPEDLHAPSLSDKGFYEGWNGDIVKKDVDCDFSQSFDHRKIVDIAVLIANSDIGDIGSFQANLAKIMNTENYNF